MSGVEMVLWWCRAGHTETAPRDAVQVWCGRGGHRGTNEMKRRDLFPSWGPAEPAPGEGRGCCVSYQDAPHSEGCRYAKLDHRALEAVSGATG